MLLSLCMVCETLGSSCIPIASHTNTVLSFLDYRVLPDIRCTLPQKSGSKVSNSTDKVLRNVFCMLQLTSKTWWHMSNLTKESATICHSCQVWTDQSILHPVYVITVIFHLWSLNMGVVYIWILYSTKYFLIIIIFWRRTAQQTIIANPVLIHHGIW